jgi:hypothetical protein
LGSRRTSKGFFMMPVPDSVADSTVQGVPVIGPRTRIV